MIEAAQTFRQTTKALEIRPITALSGAEVGGVDFRRSDDPYVVEQIEGLLFEHKVLVFRDQFGVDPKALAAFAEQFGPSESVPHPNLPDHPGVPSVKVITKSGEYGQDTWHTDGATREKTRWLSFLQAIDIPPAGRDTIFADMEAVFESMSPKFQAFLSNMRALHSWGASRPEAAPVSHPVVVENPRTGKRALYVNKGYTRAIEGLDPQESDILLDYLFRRVYIPEYQIRVVWRPGTITLWDNQRTQHYIVQDSRFLRTMHRVMVLADTD